MTTDIAEAVRARRRAEAALARERARDEEVRRVTEQARRHQQRNNFARLIAESFRRGT